MDTVISGSATGHGGEPVVLTLGSLGQEDLMSPGVLEQPGQLREMSE